jgi:hypothetical protein
LYLGSISIIVSPDIILFRKKKIVEPLIFFENITSILVAVVLFLVIALLLYLGVWQGRPQTRAKSVANKPD